ncbi:hypothetical protein LTR37_005175 [Vermiconidia calcicola]|uniref:Uncharacterized protein n=1 Tax=Vermiconidia calcicola TaxID=1690605 RepID=A0ACC3NJY8_9PEZI|nr:hypothetical protein LTR37_005175 [Vermiconidia calcicola]
MDLLSLPYDIRHQIYLHLLPQTEQIYIQVLGRTLTSMVPVSTSLLRTCKVLNIEASRFLYNSYLFNIIGRKKDCLTAYEKFLNTVNRYARQKVHVNAFSNGSHSSTSWRSSNGNAGKTRERRAYINRRASHGSRTC